MKTAFHRRALIVYLSLVLGGVHACAPTPATPFEAPLDTSISATPDIQGVKKRPLALGIQYD